MSADTCGCCEAPAPLTPQTVANRPGLSAIVYGPGSFASFRQTMLQGIATQPALRDLSTRQSDDYAITVLELWSAIADVLSFYQRRIANEAFLRTATERDSVLRLARLLGYELGPGSAATAQLCFTAEKNQPVSVPVGLRVQSVPAQNEKPQKYETMESIMVLPWLNAVMPYPRPAGINPLSRGRTQAYLLPGDEGLSAAKLVHVDDALLLYDGSQVPERLTLKSLDIEGEHLRCTWYSPVQGTDWSLTTLVRRWLRSLKLFGFNAPVQYTVPVEDLPILRWQLQTTDFSIGAGDILYLDAAYPDIKVGTRLLMVESGGQQLEMTVKEIIQSDQTLATLSDTVSGLRVDPGFTDIADRRQVILHQLDEAPIRFWGYHYPAYLKETELFFPGRRHDDMSFELDRAIEKFKLQQGEMVDLSVLSPNRRLMLTGDNDIAVDATLHSAAIVGLDIHARATADDPDSVVDLGMDEDHAVARRGICSAALDPFPVLTSVEPELRVGVDGVGTFLLEFPSLPVDVDETAVQLQALMRAAYDDVVLTQCEVFVIDDRLVIMPGGEQQAVIQFSASDEDETTVIELGLEPAQISPVQALLSAEFTGAPALTRLPAKLDLVIGPLSNRTLTLDSVPVDLEALAYDLETEMNAADPAPAYRYSRVETRNQRLWLFAGMLGQQPREYLRLRVNVAATVNMPRLTTLLRGNVAQASHGETIAKEVLGNGDPAQAFQSLTLAKSPVTHIPGASSAIPVNTLELSVNGMRWSQVETLFAQAANATVYTARQNDAGEMRITFGDGVNGARPAAGRQNIVARYRQGLGLQGGVSANTLTNALDRPKGLKAVVNPAAADGGADPETLDEARDNAPVTVKTFERAISLLDFEDLVQAGGEVAKALATWVWNHGQRTVHLTVAAQQGAVFSPSALTRIYAGLGSARDPNRPLMIDNYVPRPIVIAATLTVNDNYKASAVKTAAYDAVLAAMDFDMVGFAEWTHLSDIHAILQSVTGVEAVDVDALMFKRPAAVSVPDFEAFLDTRGIERLDDGRFNPVQGRLRILPARSNDSTPTPPVLPAEQARIDVPEQDIILLTRGGLPD